MRKANPTLALLMVILCVNTQISLQENEPTEETIQDNLQSVMRPANCFAPDTDPSVIEAYYENLNGLNNSLGSTQNNQTNGFNLNSRWSFTATDGGGLQQGDITTLTWSYVPDGTTIGNGGCGLPDAGTFSSDFISFFNGIYGPPTTSGDYTTAPWHNVFVDMFNDWSQASGLIFVYEPNDDGSTVVTNSGVLGVRGDLRISGHLVDGNSGVLACNYFPNSGDMIIDTGDNFFSNNPGLGTSNVLAHEIGHALGISHVCPVNQSKLMEPFISFAFDGPQEDDILATNRHYGDPNGNNDTSSNATFLGGSNLPASYSATQVSIDDNGDTDYFSFSVNAAATLSGTLTPTGSTYLSGQQNSNGSCSSGSNFNAQSVSNLMLEILNTNGTTVIATAASNGAGSPENLSNISLPSAGTYFARVRQESSVNNVQMYDLNINLASNSTDTPPTAMCTNITAQLNASGNVTIQASDVDNGSSDPEGPVTLSVTPNSFNCNDVGANTVTLTVTDSMGQTDTCTATVTVEDNISPTANCQNTTVQLDGSGNATIGAANINNNSSDNCGIASLSVSPNTFNCTDIGINTVTLTVTDDNGNVSTCNSTVTVVDAESPTITCPANVTASTDSGSCTASGVALGNPIATDNCTVNNISNNAPTNFPIGVTSVIWSVTDEAGNSTTCTQTVTIIDDENPIVTCPDDDIVLVNPGELFTLPDYTTSAVASDNCTANPTLSQNPTSGTQVGVGTTTVTITVSDDAGNTIDCTFNVIVDNIAGIQDNALANQLVLFPNPTAGVVTLVHQGNEQLQTLIVTDINGRTIQTVSLEAQDREIDFSLESLANGMYFITIIAENTSAVKQIIKR